MKKDKKPKYFIYAYWKNEDSFEDAWEYVDYCYSERTMITSIKQALAKGYTIKVRANKTEA